MECKWQRARPFWKGGSVRALRCHIWDSDRPCNILFSSRQDRATWPCVPNDLKHHHLQLFWSQLIRCDRWRRQVKTVQENGLWAYGEIIILQWCQWTLEQLWSFRWAGKKIINTRKLLVVKHQPGYYCDGKESISEWYLTQVRAEVQEILFRKPVRVGYADPITRWR